MEDAARLDKGLTGSDQVLYCLSRRGPEFDLLPWMRQHSIPLMAYSPLDQGGLLRKPALKKLALEAGSRIGGASFLLTLPVIDAEKAVDVSRQ